MDHRYEGGCSSEDERSAARPAMDDTRVLCRLPPGPADASDESAGAGL